LSVSATHDVVAQRSPWQQSSPLAPHATHFSVALSQTNGSPQKLPPVASGQHASPLPPHGAHVPALFVLNGAVQATLPAHAACPIFPHAPDWHPPFVHVPWAPPHVPPDAMHVFVV
jgi:hypothetical protein